MGVADVEVSVWARTSGTTWAEVDVIDEWRSLTWERRHLQAGPWSMQLPYTAQTARITKKHLLTFSLRGRREMTGVIEHVGPQSDEHGKPQLELSGVDAMTYLGDVLCWPVPTAALAAQSVARWTATGPAETVLRALIVANLPRAYAVAVPTSQGRGGTVTVSLRFHNLLNQVVAKCELGGLGVTLGLDTATPTSTRATLALHFYVPRDLSARVFLSPDTGTLGPWSQSDDAPTATRVITGGGGTGTTRIFRQVTSAAAETEWGRVREVFADARDTTVAAELDERATSDLTDAAAQSSFDLTATDAAGMRYGTTFDLADSVTVELLQGVSKVDRLNAVVVTADDSGLTVQLRPGNPDGAHPLFAQSAIIRGLRQQLRDLQQEA